MLRFCCRELSYSERGVGEQETRETIQHTALVLSLLSGPGDPGPSGEGHHLPGVRPDFQPVWQRDGGVRAPHRRQTECEYKGTNGPPPLRSKMTRDELKPQFSVPQCDHGDVAMH